VAREARGDEPAPLWNEAADYGSGYDTYRVGGGERDIPIVVLERAQAGRAPARDEQRHQRPHREHRRADPDRRD
jgi:hypothetical protein